MKISAPDVKATKVELMALLAYGVFCCLCKFVNARSVAYIIQPRNFGASECCDKFFLICVRKSFILSIHLRLHCFNLEIKF